MPRSKVTRNINNLSEGTSSESTGVTRSSTKRGQERSEESQSETVTRTSSEVEPKRTKKDSKSRNGKQGSGAKTETKSSRATLAHENYQVKKGEHVKGATGEQAKGSPGSSTQNSDTFSGPSKDAKKKDTSSRGAHSSAPHASETQKLCSLHTEPITSNTICYIGYGIYLSSLWAVCTNFLQANKITHVLSLGKKPRESLAGINWKYLDIEDIHGAQIQNIFDPAFKFIDEGTSGTNKILVHCQMGYSRSPAVVIGYLHAKKNYSLFQAFVWVATRRPRIWLLRDFKEYFAKKASEEGSGSTSVDFNLPGDNADSIGGRVDANRTHLEKLHVSFSGCVKDGREDECVVFWTEESKESASSNAP